jgi:hypothetical protein
MNYMKLHYCRKNLLGFQACISIKLNTKILLTFYRIVLSIGKKPCINYCTCNFGSRSWTHLPRLHKKGNYHFSYWHSTLDCCISSCSVPLHVDNNHSLFGLANNRCIYPLQEIYFWANTIFSI